MNQNPSKFTDKEYPIQAVWPLATSSIHLVALPILVVLFSFFIWLTLLIPEDRDFRNIEALVYLGWAVLSPVFVYFNALIHRATFHYELDDHYINIRSGLIRRAVRNVHYGVIQNVILRRGITDRIFGLATLIIQNASQDPNEVRGPLESPHFFFGNGIVMYGLSKEDAENVKNKILDKIRTSPTIEQGM